MQVRNLLVEILIGIALCSCATTGTESSRNDTTPRHSNANSGPELRGVGFLPNRPAGKDSLMEAAEDPESAKVVLLRDIETMTRFDEDYVFRIVGNTDDKECPNKEQCIDLSKRRAQLLHAWLISNGLPSRKLKNPIGYGSSRPMQDNSKIEGRRANRNAFINFED